MIFFHLLCMQSLEFGVNFTRPAHLRSDWPHFKRPVATVWLVATMLESSVEAEVGAPPPGGRSTHSLGLRAVRGSRSPLTGGEACEKESRPKENTDTNRQGACHLPQLRSSSLPWGRRRGTGGGQGSRASELEGVESRFQGFKTNATKQAILMNWPTWSWFICSRWLSLPVLWGQNFSGIADKGADQQFMWGH